MSEVIEARAGEHTELRSGWRLLVAALLGTGLGLPTLPFYTVGIFAPVFAAQFGWSFASIFGGLIVTTCALLFGAPVAGHLVDRYGARKVASISLAGFGLGYMTLALSNGSLAQYYVSWAVFSLAGLGATTVSFTRAVNAAFVERRGLALGITLSGIGLVALAVKPLAGWLVELAGWRTSIVVIGALPLMLGMPLVLWGLPVERSDARALAKAAIAGPGPAGLTWREAVRTRTFAVMVCAFVTISFANAAPVPHLENILRSANIDPRQIVALTSLIGAAMVAGRLIGGWLLDQVWAPLLALVILAGAACGCWILSQQVLTETQAMVAILLLGFAGGVEIDLLSYLIARYMGVRHYGAIFGTIFGLFAVGAGAGPSLIGFAYDRLGGYSQIMMACTVLLLIPAGLLLTLGRYPNGGRG